MVVCKKTPEVYLVFEHEVDYFLFQIKLIDHRS